jgi:hypothetical protein
MAIRGWAAVGLIAGVVIALTIPLVELGLAFAWDRRLIDPDPNGPMMQAVESIAPVGLLLGPIGIVVAARSGGVTGALRWAAVLLWTLPAFAILWFGAAAWLGGLAGEPF